MKKGWIQRTERDILALGSIVFYLLVFGRAMIGPYYPFVFQLSFSALILFIIFLLHKNFDTYIARGIILTASTIYFYEDFVFSLFAAAVFVLMLISSFHLDRLLLKIIKGFLFGAGSFVTALIASRFFNV